MLLSFSKTCFFLFNSFVCFWSPYLYLFSDNFFKSFEYLLFYSTPILFFIFIIYIFLFCCRLKNKIPLSMYLFSMIAMIIIIYFFSFFLSSILFQKYIFQMMKTSICKKNSNFFYNYCSKYCYNPILLIFSKKIYSLITFFKIIYSNLQLIILITFLVLKALYFCTFLHPFEFYLELLICNKYC